MQINSSSQKTIIGAIIALALAGASWYFFFSGGEEIAPPQVVDKTLLSPEVKKFLEYKDKINVKDTSFTTKELYSQLRDYSQDIPFKVPEGRSNPFVPYATP